MLPNPLLSLRRPTAGRSDVRYSQSRAVVDGDPTTAWNAGKPTAERPAWVAIDVGRGPTSVLLRWSAAGSFDYEETDYGSPGAYRVEVSADSSDGADGSWSVLVEQPRVTTHGEAHRLAFTGQRWVRMVVTAAPAASPNGVQLDEIAVHDASVGEADTWFFAGDSITAFAMGRMPAPSARFAALVHARHPSHYPLVLNGGMGGDTSEDGARRIRSHLAMNPDVRTWAICYGANDAAGDASDTTRFRRNILAIVDAVRDAGRTAILATIPFATEGHRHIPRFNAAIDEVRRERGLAAGPDLYAWFAAHPDELADGLHPNERGIASINRLWAEAVDSLYP